MLVEAALVQYSYGFTENGQKLLQEAGNVLGLHVQLGGACKTAAGCSCVPSPLLNSHVATQNGDLGEVQAPSERKDNESESRRKCRIRLQWQFHTLLVSCSHICTEWCFYAIPPISSTRKISVGQMAYFNKLQSQGFPF